MLDEKVQIPWPTRRPSKKFGVFHIFVPVVVFTILTCLALFGFLPVGWRFDAFLNSPSKHHSPQLVRTYDLTVGARWMNLDGGRWRLVFVCNGQTPCPTLTADEGDILKLREVNDLGIQSSLHIAGMSHKRFGYWNDGTAGLNQYPTLPRANWTSTYDTTGEWGLYWYGEHTSAAVVDGVYGMVYIAPAASRPRPYSSITSDPQELLQIQDAEKKIHNMALWNFDHRTIDWKLAAMRDHGASIYCYKSVLINAKGRVHCRNPDYTEINGQALDEAGCIPPPGNEGEKCTPTTADYYVVETGYQKYIMLNVINIGFENEMKFSVDSHKMWVVANDGGFVEPQEVDVVYVPSGSRFQVLIKLDQRPQDYTIRLASASAMQHLESFAILRYPAKRYPVYGEPMELPAPLNPCLRPDSSVPSACKELDSTTLVPYDGSKPPSKSDITLHWKTGSRPSQTDPYINEVFVNEKPWQLFRGSLAPVLFTENFTELEKPVQYGLPLGSTIDLIVENTFNESIPMYKHGAATYLLGMEAHSEFSWASIDDAVKAGANLNLENPSKALVHDLPPNGWIAIRWKIESVGATMFHAVKVRYFALGMSAPLMEGIMSPVDVPDYALNRAHVEFEPKNDGVFG